MNDGAERSSPAPQPIARGPRSGPPYQFSHARKQADGRVPVM
jgi:hypothetical protein